MPLCHVRAAPKETLRLTCAGKSVQQIVACRAVRAKSVHASLAAHRLIAPRARAATFSFQLSTFPFILPGMQAAGTPTSKGGSISATS
jgi:hypothetical protein